jgi:crotonobetainyl-CoA:carnitine CoA-transferase CaiB-like acyl-CoA transferase
MHAEIVRVFSQLRSDDIVKRLEEAAIANARLNSMEEFWRHPQLEARDRWRTVGSPAGDLAALKPPFNLDGMEPRMDPIPAVGEHTHAILAELGYSDEDIQRMTRDATI